MKSMPLFSKLALCFLMGLSIVSCNTAQHESQKEQKKELKEDVENTQDVDGNEG